VKLSQLKNVVPGARAINFHDREIRDISCDSRDISEGCLFVAVSGEEQDGHPFAIDALANGAAAMVVERKLDLPEDTPQIIVNDSREAAALLSAKFCGYPSELLRVIGITGTNGKTTRNRGQMDGPDRHDPLPDRRAIHSRQEYNAVAGEDKQDAGRYAPRGAGMRRDGGVVALAGSEARAWD
jgi:hypothetical protein